MPRSDRPRVLAIVPARGGSKGIPGKNVRPFCGRPLLEYTLDAARDAVSVTNIVLSTDNDDIAAIGRARAGVTVVERPAALAEDGTPMMPVVVHALQGAEAHASDPFDAVVLLQPTSPLRLAGDIDDAVDLLMKTSAECVASVCESQEHPLKAKRIVNDQLVPFSAAEPGGGLRQALPVSYRRNGAIYVFRRDVALREDPLRDAAVRPFLMPIERSIDIDSPFDFKVAEFLMRERLAGSVQHA